ncbi:MAG: Glycerophosphocholine phosphodiesterase [Geoglossum simile]|nr:MAG: Glycerophosphocholine phosphodiesterase [Geoglossum simile]
MRFGRNLHRHRVPEWTPFYISYNGLKKLFKLVVRAAADQQADVDFTVFFAALSRDINRVESFYLTKYAIIEQKAVALFDHYGISPHFPDTLDLDELEAEQYELEDILLTSIELRTGIKKLQWYGKVNRDGFRKLFQKLGSLSSGSRLGDSELCKSQFVSQVQCLEDLERINRSISSLSRVSFQGRSSSNRLSLFLGRFCGRFYPTLVSQSAVYCAIRRDDASHLDQMLREQLSGDPEPDTRFQALLLVLLQCSISCGSRKCIDKLIAQLDLLEDGSFVAHDNCFHRLIISMGRSRIRQYQVHLKGSADPIDNAEGSLPMLAYMLDQLRPNQRHALLQKDLFGRLPLHYAAQYGLVEPCQMVLARMRDWGLFHNTLLQDSEGYTPMHLGIINGHAGITRTFLEFQKSTKDTVKMADDRDSSGALLAIALMSGSVDIVKLLVATKVDLNRRSKDGETALYIAARSGREDCVRILIEAAPKDKLDIDIPETVYGQTPLIVACVEGHLPIAEILLQAGANQGTTDVFGLTAKDHAAFRGFLPLAERLTASNLGNSSYIPRSTHTETRARPPSPTDETKIFVNLGSLNTHKQVSAVDLSPYLSVQPYNPYPETGFSVKICAIGASGSSDMIQLPVLDDTANDPWLFLAKDVSEVKLVFNIFNANTDPQEHCVVIGSAVALLESLKQGLGLTRESFIRDYTIPILEKHTLEFIGTVTFDFVVVKPFPHPVVAPIAVHEIWKSAQVVGHRGLGQNIPTTEHLQVGENTIQVSIAVNYQLDDFSDKRAVVLDCNRSRCFVHRDVQLTRDHVPVIYHDFLVSESGADLPPHALSLDQFMHISEVQAPRDNPPFTAGTRHLEGFKGQLDHCRKSRSRSLNSFDDGRTQDFVDRMKQTFEFKLKGFKGNTRGDHIHESFTTLEEMLQVIPETVGIDIELKYPMLWEAENWKMDPYGIELNTLVDIILDKAYTFGGNRAIIFTSFSPELCILLSHKQQTYPVLFLNESGLYPTGDVRASNLQEAVHFAKSWNLPGVVMSSEPLVISPKLVKYVKDAGLVCASFGILNDDPENARIQAKAGVDAIIVDSVRLIVNTLRSMGCQTL